MTDHAAGLTYYALLSLFPALLLGVSLLGLFGERALVGEAAAYLTRAGAPEEAVNAVTSSLESAVEASGGKAAGAFALGLATAVYGASGAFGAAGRALNVVWRVDEGRSFVRRKLVDIAWTLAVLLLVVLTMVLVFLGGGLAEDVLGSIGLGDTAAAIWTYARWPGALCTALGVYALIYYAAPNVRVPHIEWITPGALVGVTLWLAASGGFFVYVSNFSNYGATYGTFAGAVILLVWLWITNIVMLFGAELNAVVRLRSSPELPRTYEGPPLPEKVPAERD